MNVLVTGASGYVGAMLVPWLLEKGHHVTALDTQWFGTGHLPDNGNLEIIQGDIRTDFERAVHGIDAVIYLASLSNNEACEHYPDLAEQVNVSHFAENVSAARAAGVAKFIYASSVAVYGSTEIEADENHSVEPETSYARAKWTCEKTLFAEAGGMACAITRSASVCGYSLNMAFHLTANKMVHDGYRRGFILVNGGEQIRCHITMRDIIDAYLAILHADVKAIDRQAFNLVTENQKVKDTAYMAQAVMEYGCAIQFGPATDGRSYAVDGSKAARVLKFVPKRRVADALHDVYTRFNAGYWKDSLSNPAYRRIPKDVS